jgi:hypothetical protein
VSGSSYRRCTPVPGARRALLDLGSREQVWFSFRASGQPGHRSLPLRPTRVNGVAP